MASRLAWRERLEELFQGFWWQQEPSLLARTLQPLSWLYAALTALRSLAYASGVFRTHRVGVPVVVVGNLIAGGAGKTPTVVAVVEALRGWGYRPGIVSRGHGRQDQSAQLVVSHSNAADVGDEPLLLARRTGVPVAVASRRVDAARLLLGAHPEVNALVSDDGLQHLALARDAQVIVFDGRGIGNGLLLPAGPLRQAMSPKPPERSLVLYNHGHASVGWPGELAGREVHRAIPLRAWRDGELSASQPLESLRHTPVLALAGIAQPTRFFDMLRARGLVVEPRPLPDHHRFVEWPWSEEQRPILVTEKDAIKLNPEAVGNAQVWVVPLDFSLPQPFLEALRHLLPPPP